MSNTPKVPAWRRNEPDPTPPVKKPTEGIILHMPGPAEPEIKPMVSGTRQDLSAWEDLVNLVHRSGTPLRTLLNEAGLDEPEDLDEDPDGLVVKERILTFIEGLVANEKRDTQDPVGIRSGFDWDDYARRVRAFEINARTARSGFEWDDYEKRLDAYLTEHTPDWDSHDPYAMDDGDDVGGDFEKAEYDRITRSSRIDPHTPLPTRDELLRWAHARRDRPNNPYFVHQIRCGWCMSITSHEELWYNHDPRNRVLDCLSCHTVRLLR